MENKIIEVTPDEISPAYSEALRLHQEIMTNEALAVQAIVEFSRCLKRMRDEKLYISLGYSEFEEYCEDKAKIKKRQANNYIEAYENLGAAFMRENPFGITKFVELIQVPALDRAEFVEKHDIAAMSVSELKEEIKKLKEENCMKGEQLNLLQEQIDTEETKEAEYKLQVAALTAEIAELKEQADKPSQDIDKIKKELKAQAKEKQDKAVRAAIDKEHKAIAEQHKAEIEEATADLKNQVEGYKKKLELQQENTTEAMQKAAELEKKLKDSRTDNDTKFSVLFELLQESLEGIFNVLDKIESDKQKKYAGKLCELADTIKDTAEEF